MSSTYVSSCGACGEPTVAQVRLDHYDTSMMHDGREYLLSLSDVEAYRCDSCQEVTLDDDGENLVTLALYKAAKLLLPSQIRSERERLGYKSKDFADLLGVSPSTLSRWENGYQIQQRQTDRAMRQFFAVPAARDYAAMLKDGHAAALEVPCKVFDWSSRLESFAQVHATSKPTMVSFSWGSMGTGSSKVFTRPNIEFHESSHSGNSDESQEKLDPRIAA